MPKILESAAGKGTRLAPTVTALLIAIVPFIAYASTIGTTHATAVKNNSAGSTAVRVLLENLVSGKPGTETLEVRIGTGVVLPNDTQFYGITGIGIREVGNRPCQLQLFGGLLDPDYATRGRLLGEGALPRCDRSVLIDFKVASFEDRNNRFVRGVKGCIESSRLSSNILELKGVEIYPAEIRATGEVVQRKHTTRFERPNCGSWDDEELCNAGQIMVGIIMHAVEDQFTGMQPICRSVKAMPEPAGFPRRDQSGY